MGIKELPKLERPREKALLYGLEKLSNVELIAILIGSGTKDRSALDISYELLDTYKGIFNLSNAPFLDLTKTKGISKITAIKLGAVFEIYKRISQSEYQETNITISQNYIYTKYSKIIQGDTQEILGVIILNGNKKVIREKLLYKGTKVELSASYLEIFKEVLIADGKYFYIFHNHPEGNPYPSDKDIIFTSGLIKEAIKLKIKMIDHIIIGKNSYFSFIDAKVYS